MKALVVYESMFGNTAEVARSVADGLADHLDVTVRAVADAPAQLTEPYDLVVVGGPTHALSMSRPSTRADAVEQGAPETVKETGIREWLDGLGDGPRTALFATFDTRAEKARHMPGSAAKKAARVARKQGFSLADKKKSFFVDGMQGPLEAGETSRARAWGERLGADVAARTAAAAG
jgi:flavodoxin